MKIPKKWRGVNGALHHTVAINADPGTGVEVVTSRFWSARKGWRYTAESRPVVEWTLKLNRKRQKDDL